APPHAISASSTTPPRMPSTHGRAEPSDDDFLTGRLRGASSSSSSNRDLLVRERDGFGSDCKRSVPLECAESSSLGSPGTVKVSAQCRQRTRLPAWLSPRRKLV